MKIYSAFILCALISMSFAQTSTTKSKQPVKSKSSSKPAYTLKTKMDTISYFLGMQIGSDLKTNGAVEILPSVLQKGLADALKDQPSLVSPQAGMTYMQEYFGAKQAAKAAAEQAQRLKF